MFKRGVEEVFLRSVRSFPAVILTGARQTGKSTLCKTLLHQSHRYVSLEDPDLRQMALHDPRTFLKIYPPPVILDEIQYAPDLPSYLQGIIDEHRRKFGQFVLTGSQNFLLMEKVTQSLAGRAALLTLFPCSVGEVSGSPAVSRSTPEAVADWILRGGYPELRDRQDLDRRTWCGSYIRLYLERDVRSLVQVDDLESFERFLQLVAIRTGQILNMSDLARDAGISPPTAQRWLSVLQASYQVHLLRPFHANLSKRLVKAPKLYFGDTALASTLMGLHDPEPLLKGPFLGPLFETAVFLEHLKWGSFRGDLPKVSYFRTKDGLEADLVIEEGGKIFAREFTTNRTLNPSLGTNLLKIERLLKKPITKCVLAPVVQRMGLSNTVTLRPWHDVEWSSQEVAALGDS